MMNKGPIPEGTYHVRRLSHQTLENLSWHEYLMHTTFLTGNWRGGENAWGKKRIWVQPILGTCTYRHGGFAIHGGAIPGSIGFVDLTRYGPNSVKH